MRSDVRGTPVSTTDAAALAAFEQALRQYQSYVGDPIATIERALAERPDFVLGHLFRACALMAGVERRFFALARGSVEAAEGMREHANERERGLMLACRLLVDGDWDGACAAFDRVLVEFPRDAVALQTAHLFDFARGDAKNLRDRVTRVLPSWSPADPGYSYVLGMHAFGLEECNEYEAARDAAERALAIERADGWAVHAAVHCMEMRGLVADGIAFLEARKPDWAPDNSFAFHNFWHLALFHLDRDDTASVLALFDRHVYPEASDLALTLVDATALLWRLHLLGVDTGARFARVADVWQAKLDGERGFYAFNDVHALLAFAATGREALVARVAGELERPEPGTNGAMTRDVGLPVARAILAFAHGRYERCVYELAAVRDIAHRFGGSHAQRDLLTLTLIEAALRGGQASVARHYLNERSVQRPHSGLGQRLQARARA